MEMGNIATKAAVNSPVMRKKGKAFIPMLLPSNRKGNVYVSQMTAENAGNNSIFEKENFLISDLNCSSNEKKHF
jgi:hypothetical protein